MSTEKKLSKDAQARVEDAQEWVDRQAASLERLEPALRKLDAGDELTKRDRRTLKLELALSDEEIEEAHAADPNETAVKNILREPVAFFYLADGSQVQVRPGGDVRVVDADSDEQI